MNIILSKNGNHLLFIDAKFEDSIEVGTTIGCLAIEEGADTKKVLAFAKKQKWEFEGEENASGFTKVVRA